MDVGTFSFGKYRGWTACDVPVDYLAWAMETMGKPPYEVLEELKRRAARFGSRDAITAQTILVGLTYRKTKRAKRIARTAKARSSQPRKVTAESVGEGFEAARAAFQGDLSECPF